MHSRNVVITGAGRGIGLEMSRELVSQGHTVYGAVRDPDGAKALQDLQPAAILELDIGNHESIVAFGEALAEVTPNVDVLVNNAGISCRTLGLGADDTGPWAVDPHVVLAMTDTNALGPMLVTRAVIDLLEVGDNPVVLNTSSQLGSMAVGGGHPFDLAYNISKAALNMITVACASTNPRVSFVALHPGWVKTDMGSEAAELEIADSAAAIVTSLLTLTLADSGRFIRWDGTDHPW